MEHKNTRQLHRIENWAFADTAEREALAGTVILDIGKIAYQEDDGTYWRLVDNSPTWGALAVSAGGARYRPSGTLGNSANEDVDAAAHDTFNVLIQTNDTEFAIVGMSDGQSIVVPLNSNGQASTWPGVEWKGIATPLPVPSAVGVDVYTFVKCGFEIFGTFAAQV